MALIDFPDVPALAGVPELRRQPGADTADSSAASADFSDVEDALPPTWGVYDANGMRIIAPDSVLSFKYNGVSKVASYPLELGGFSSYNKTYTPYTIDISMTCAGQGEMAREDFLGTLGDMRSALDLYAIVTPDQVYQNANLVSYDYTLDRKDNGSLLTVNAHFIEINLTASAVYAQTATAAATPKKTSGTLKPLDLNKVQASIFDERGLA